MAPDLSKRTGVVVEAGERSNGRERHRADADGKRSARPAPTRGQPHDERPGEELHGDRGSNRETSSQSRVLFAPRETQKKRDDRSEVRDAKLTGDLWPQETRPVYAPVSKTDDPKRSCKYDDADEGHDHIRRSRRQKGERSDERRRYGRPDEVAADEGLELGAWVRVRTREHLLGLRVELVMKVDGERVRVASHQQHHDERHDGCDRKERHRSDAPERLSESPRAVGRSRRAHGVNASTAMSESR